MDVLRGALTNLGKYNEGKLDFVWVSFPCDEDDFQDSLEKIGIGEDRGDGSVYEEWFFSDWDTDYDWVDLDGLGEYMDLDEVNEYAEALENIVDDGNEEEFKAAMEYSGDFNDALNLVETGSVTKISDESMSNRMDEATLAITVNLEVKTTEESGIDTNVVLVCLLVRRIRSCHLSESGATEVRVIT